LIHLKKIKADVQNVHLELKRTMLQTRPLTA